MRRQKWYSCYIEEECKGRELKHIQLTAMAHKCGWVAMSLCEDLWQPKLELSEIVATKGEVSSSRLVWSRFFYPFFCVHLFFYGYRLTLRKILQH